ncbi:MAG: ABC transporter permease [Patescibacteria group bacterium]|jgi:putative ABC transport system permease protein
MEILRNMWRRKFRTFLTIFGITIGIFAFTVMGSMALKFQKMIDGGKRYITGQITIVPKGSNFMAGGTGTLPVDTLEKIAKTEGVEAVGSSVELALDEPDPDNPTGGGFNVGPPPTIEGMDLNSSYENRNWKTLDVKEGRMLKKGDPDDVVVYGSSVAIDKKVKVGEKTKIRGKDFTVIGILEKTMTGPDSYVMMPINPARELYIEANPFLKSLKQQADEAAKISDTALAKLPKETRDQLTQAKTFKIEDVSTAAAASWKDGYDSDEVATKIKDKYKEQVMVLSPKKMGEEIDKASAIFYSVILGSAMMALIVGGFSIINTMIMSISERTKEIGIKKAIGASNTSIALEYTIEAGIIGLVGGLIGMGIGALAANAINSKMAEKGAEIFLLDSWYLSGVVAFSFILGILAGIIPAMRASKMRVVEAIREL